MGSASFGLRSGIAFALALWWQRLPLCGGTSSSSSSSRGGSSGVCSPFSSIAWVRTHPSAPAPRGRARSLMMAHWALAAHPLVVMPWLSSPHPALSCVQGTNASGLAVLAISAFPAGSMPAVASARAGAAPTTGGALPRSCASTHKGSTSPASAFLAVPASPKGSTFPGNAGELSSTGGTP